MKTLASLALAAALVSAAALPARADLAWTETVTTVLTLDGADQTLAQTQQNYSLKENVVRIDNPDQKVSRIINFQNRQVVLIDFNSRSYANVSMSDLIRESNDRRTSMSRALAQREAALDQMPPDARRAAAAQIEAMKKKIELWSRNYEVVETEDHQVIDGHACTKYEGRAGGEKFQEIWMATDVALDRSYPIYFGQGMASIDPQEYSYLARLAGFPIRVVTRYAGVTVTTDMSNVRDQRLPADFLKLPPDLKPALNVVEGR